MKKLFSLFLFFFLFTTVYLFSGAQKTHAYSLCQTNGSAITCRSGTATWSCPTSWVCACTPAYAYASGGSRCTSSSTYSEGVGFRGSDGKYHNCYFAKIIPFSSSCGSYTSPTLTRSTKCTSNQSTVTFNWTGVKDADSYQVGWTGGTPVTVSSSTRLYTAIVPSNTNISWWIKIHNEVGWFGQKFGTNIISATCSAPPSACTYTYSAWGPDPCPTSGTQTRTYTSSPAGCTGTPVASQSCTPPTVKYACNTSTYNCSVSATGSYTTSASCEAACVAPPPPPPPPTRLTPCDGSSIFGSFAPTGVPIGGICMLNKIIAISLNILLAVSIIFALIFLILGGISWITSEGDKQKLSQAKKKIEFAVIGIIIVLASYMVVKFIYSFFNINNSF